MADFGSRAGGPKMGPNMGPGEVGLESGKRLVYVGIPPQLPPSSVAKEARKLAPLRGRGVPRPPNPSPVIPAVYDPPRVGSGADPSRRGVA